MRTLSPNTESGPFEDLREIEVTQPLHVVPSHVPSSDDLYLTISQTHITITVDIESEPEEAPLEVEESLPLVSRAPLTDEEFEALESSDTRTTSSHFSAPSNFTAPLSPDHLLTQTLPTPPRAFYYRSTSRMAVRTQLTMSPGYSARLTEAIAMSPFSSRKRYRPSRETPSPTGDEIGDDSEGDEVRDEDTDPDMDSEDFEGRGQQSPTQIDLPTRLTWVDLKDGTIYLDFSLDPRSLPSVQISSPSYSPLLSIGTPSSPEWSTEYIPEPLPIPSLVAAAPVGVDEFLEMCAQLALNKAMIQDHTERLDALPPTLFEHYDRDLRELYTRLGVVRQMPREQLSGMLYMQIAAERRERLELTYRVARMERRQESRGE
ncbi:hypothetical protein Tco_1043383 [Tanacetum coccineum]|uniref:Uncharacterized protein n=1 Tax=Tanacetum coccineum TaxID=301880 RepID=A0ABQ5GPG6_9ASTR